LLLFFFLFYTLISRRTNDTINADIDALLDDDWLDCHIYRYVQSLADHCARVSLTLVGLIDRSSIKFNDQQQQQHVLERIHDKLRAFIMRTDNTWSHVHIHSDLFPMPIAFDDINMSTLIIEQLETIARKNNIIHDKRKRLQVHRLFRFVAHDCITMDYETCSKYFQQQLSSFVDKSDGNELDTCLEYLELIGDILIFKPTSNKTIIFKPYYLFNEILRHTIFRPNLEQWLDYDKNLVFRFSGYYTSEDMFVVDRQRLILRGEWTWTMLTAIFFEQNNDSILWKQEHLIRYCQLMEHLYLGYVNPSNCSCT
jgi:hypothetical protein